ncbi:TPA: hypothetical protein ACH3X2_013104 [Trebouxia sp. C0005]
MLEAMKSPLMAQLFQPAPPSHVVRSTAKAHQPDIFNGTAAEHGPKALQWVRTFELYAQAENEPNPVSKAATHLRGSAQDWWHTVALHQLPPNPTFEAFKGLFLRRYVKPSDSAEARSELPQLKQAQKSVEEYATAFRQMNSRITVRSPVETTTLAVWFISGLKDNILRAMRTHESIATMHDLDLAIDAAISMEAKLNLASRQAAPSVAVATAANGQGHGPVRNRGGRGRGNSNPPICAGVVAGVGAGVVAGVRLLAGGNSLIKAAQLHHLHSNNSLLSNRLLSNRLLKALIHATYAAVISIAEQSAGPC